MHEKMGMSTERFLFMVSGKNVPSTRFRMLPYVSALRSLGYSCDVAYSYPEKYDSYRLIGWRLSQRLKRSVRKWQVLKAGFTGYSAIVIERELFDSPDFQIEEQVSKLSAKLILDVDDGVFLRYPEKFRRLVQLSDHVIAGSSIIAAKLEPDSKSISVIPTVLDLDEYPTKMQHDHVTDAALRIGWIGTDSNVEYLNLVMPAIRRIQQEHSCFLRVITGSKSSLQKLDTDGVEVEFFQWDPATAIQKLSECHIGVMPLPDEEWQQYKCGCKLLQYMACWIPSIASPVGVNRDIIRHGSNGLLAATTEEWQNCLGRLLKQHTLRNELGQNGRSTVEESFSLSSQITRFLTVLTS